MHALVLADGDAPARAALDAAFPGWDDDVGLVIAADGGARSAAALGRRIDVAVGDFDSLGRPELDELERMGVAIERASTDKDETDTELAIAAALARGASRVTVLGAFGGPRLDHELANVGLLAMSALVGMEAVLLDPRGRISLLVAPGPDGRAVERRLAGGPGSIVSLVPWGVAAVGVTTRDLRYPLTDEDLPVGPARGVSNVVAGTVPAVTLRAGRLVLVEGPATLAS